MAVNVHLIQRVETYLIPIKYISNKNTTMENVFPLSLISLFFIYDTTTILLCNAKVRYFYLKIQVEGHK